MIKVNRPIVRAGVLIATMLIPLAGYCETPVAKTNHQYFEVGALTADGINIVNYSLVHRWGDLFGFVSFGLPLLAGNAGLGISASGTGHGLNVRLGMFTPYVIYTSLTYNWQLSEKWELEAGWGYGQVHFFTAESGNAPVLSFRYHM